MLYHGWTLKTCYIKKAKPKENVILYDSIYMPVQNRQIHRNITEVLSGWKEGEMESYCLMGTAFLSEKTKC